MKNPSDKFKLRDIYETTDLDFQKHMLNNILNVIIVLLDGKMSLFLDECLSI